MSRTDKTRPVSVRMMDPQDQKIGVHEFHNHIKGYCDLPERNAKDMDAQYDIIRKSSDLTLGQSCHYGFAYKGSNMCGCKMCTGQHYRKSERRGTRHNSKASLKKHTKEVNSHLALMEEVNTLKEVYDFSGFDELADALDEDMAYLEPEPAKAPSVSW